MKNKRAYVLETRDEFERLERQSKTPQCNFEHELAELLKFSQKKNAKILDAGCGSGIVARELASVHPQAQIIGCDFSDIRVAQAAASAKTIKNLSFEVQDLTRLGFSDDTFDVVVCRYVIEHLSADQQKMAMREIFRILKPGGKAYIVDIDGILLNLYPQTPSVSSTIKIIQDDGKVDLSVGRKLPTLVLEAGFPDAAWVIETLLCSGKTMETEIELMEGRLTSMLPYLISLLRSKERAEEFRKEYLRLMQVPGAVLFYNKFILSAVKPSSH